MNIFKFKNDDIRDLVSKVGALTNTNIPIKLIFGYAEDSKIAGNYFCQAQMSNGGLTLKDLVPYQCLGDKPEYEEVEVTLPDGTTGKKAVLKKLSICVNSKDLIQNLRALIDFTTEAIIMILSESFIQLTTESKKTDIRVGILPTSEIKSYSINKNDIIIQAAVKAKSFLNALNEGAYAAHAGQSDKGSYPLSNFIVSFAQNTSEEIVKVDDEETVEKKNMINILSAKASFVAFAKSSISAEFSKKGEKENPIVRERRGSACKDSMVSTVDDYKIAIPLEALNPIKSFISVCGDAVMLVCDQSHMNLQTSTSVLTVTLEHSVLNAFLAAEKTMQGDAASTLQLDAHTFDKALDILNLSGDEDTRITMTVNKKDLVIKSSDKQCVKCEILAVKGENFNYICNLKLLKDAIRRKGNLSLRLIPTSKGVVLAVCAASADEEVDSCSIVLPALVPSADTEESTKSSKETVDNVENVESETETTSAEDVPFEN